MHLSFCWHISILYLCFSLTIIIFPGLPRTRHMYSNSSSNCFCLASSTNISHSFLSVILLDAFVYLFFQWHSSLFPASIPWPSSSSSCGLSCSGCCSFYKPPCLLILCSMTDSCQTNVEWCQIWFSDSMVYSQVWHGQPDWHFQSLVKGPHWPKGLDRGL